MTHSVTEQLLQGALNAEPELVDADTLRRELGAEGFRTSTRSDGLGIYVHFDLVDGSIFFPNLNGGKIYAVDQVTYSLLRIATLIGASLK